MTVTKPVPKFVTPADAEMSGAAIQSFLNSILSDDIRPHMAQVMAKYGYDIDNIDPEGWYSVPMTFELNRVLVRETRNALILVSVGTAIVDTVPMPAEIDSIPSAIKMLMEIQKMATRNMGEHPMYHSITVEDRRVTFVDHTPYAHDLIYGYIYGIARRYAPEGTAPVVERTYLNPDDPDSDGAHYEVTW